MSECVKSLYNFLQYLVIQVLFTLNFSVMKKKEEKEKKTKNEEEKKQKPKKDKKNKCDLIFIYWQ